MKIISIIPARSGSKSVKNKNVRNFKGKPLLAWSIVQSLNTKKIDRTILSTDSEEYKKIGEKYGAEVPFLRPKEISGDLSSDYEFIRHCIEWLKKNENYEPDIIVQLRPTYPLRNIKKIDEMIEKFLESKEYDSLRTVVPIHKSPYKMYTIENGTLNPLFKEIKVKDKKVKEPYNQCRQLLPTSYLHNGYVDIVKKETINKNTVTGERILPYIMEEDEIHDIDTEEELERAIEAHKNYKNIE